MIGEFLTYASQGGLTPLTYAKQVGQYTRDRLSQTKVRTETLSDKVKAVSLGAVAIAFYGPVSADEVAQAGAALKMFEASGHNALATGAAAAGIGFAAHFLSGELTRRTVESTCSTGEPYQLTSRPIGLGTIADVGAAIAEGRTVSQLDVAKSAGIIAATNGGIAGVLAGVASSQETLSNLLDTQGSTVGVWIAYAALTAMALRPEKAAPGRD